MSIGSRIKERRTQLKLTQEELAKQLCITKGAVANYENCVSVPKPDILYKVMEALDCDANFLFQDDVPLLKKAEITLQEKDMIEKFRKLDDRGKEIIQYMLDKELLLTLQAEQGASQEQPDITLIKLPYYDFPASAGIGNFTDYEYATYVEVRNPPRKADYIVRVSGDSMEPTLYDGDKLYIQKVDVLNFGDIGLFAYGGSIYVKEYGRQGLISHNKEYGLINGSEDIRILGKVLGKVEK